MELFIAWALISCLLVQVMGQEPSCFTPGSIAGAVLGTFFATLVTAAIIALIYWKYCRPTTSRKNTSPLGNVEVGTRGFDNPCFDESASSADAVDGQTTKNGLQTKQEKGWTPFRLFRLSKSSKRRAVDDSFVVAPERVEVPLRGHDFTGLGFNIAGNMRDGIYVKDVLNRGPASESGQITPGDRIESVTVSFRHMVFEDALTILSYASPYDVTLMLEKARLQGKLTPQRRATSAASLTSPNVGLSTNLGGDMNNPDRLIHPLYRSQSIDDLSKVGKEDLGAKISVNLPSGHAKLGHNKLQTQSLNIEMGKPKMDFAIGLDPNLSQGVNVSAKPNSTKFGVKVLPDLKLKPKTSVGAAFEGVDVPDSPIVTVEAPSIDISGMPKVGLDMKPRTGLSGATVNVGGKLPNLKPEVAISLPSMPDVNLSLKGPNVGGAIDVPDMDFGDGKGKKSKFSVKMPSLNFEKHSGGIVLEPGSIESELPNTEIAVDATGVPDVDVSLRAPKFEIDMPDFELDTGLKGKKSKFSLKMPQMNLGKAQANISAEPGSVKGKLPDSDISITIPDALLKAPTVDVNVPDADIAADLKGKKSKFSMKMPNINFGKHQSDISIDTDKIEGRVPELDISGGDLEHTLEVDVPDAGIGVKGKKSKFGLKMPQLNFEVPSVDISASPGQFPKTDITATLPDIPDMNVSMKGPKLDVDADLPDVDIGDVKGKKPKFSLKMPNLNFGKASTEISVDHGSIDGNLCPPEVALSVPDIPDANVSLQGPSVDLELPSVGITTDPKGKQSKFSLKMPHLNLGKPEADISVGVSSLDGHMTMPNISAELPNVDASLGAPSVDVNFPEAAISGEMKGLKAKSLKMPNMSFGKHGGDLSLETGSLEGKLPKLEITTGAPEVDLSLKAPNIDVDLPNAEVDLDLKGKKSKFGLKMPNLHFGKPQAEFSIDSGSIEGGLPNPDLSAETNLAMLVPKANVDVDFPDLDLGEGKGKKSKFSLKMPDLSFGKHHAEMNVNPGSIEGKLPEMALPDIPDVDVSVKAPIVDVVLPDIDIGGSMKDNKSKFSLKMPHLNIGKPQAQISVDQSSLEGVLPKAEISTNLPQIPDVDLSLKGPKMGINADMADVDLDAVKGKKGKFSMKMPGFGFGKPEAELSVDTGNIEGKIQKPEISAQKLDMPEAVVSLKGPNFEVDLPDVNLGGEKKGKKSKFSMKMPQLHVGKAHPEISIEPGSLEGTLIKPDLSVSVPDKPDIDLAINAPVLDVDLPDIDIGEIKGKKSKFSLKMPSMNFGKHHAEANIEGNLPNPKMSAEIPDASINMKGPKLDLDLPDAELRGSLKGKKSKFSMKMPHLGFGKSHADMSVDSGSITGKLPQPEMSVNIPDMSDVDISLKGPSVDIDPPELEIPEMKGKKSKFSMKMPNLNFGKPHADLSLDSGNFDAKLSKPEMSVNVPDLSDVLVSLKGPEVGIDLPDADLPEMKGKKSKFSMKMPNFGKPTQADLSIDPGNLDVKIPKAEISANIPEIRDVGVSLKGAEVDLPDVDLGEMKGKKSKFSMKMPNFGKPHAELSLDAGSFDAKLPKPDMSINVPDLPDVNVSLKGPEIGVDLPDADLPEMKGKKSKFSMKMPNFGKPHAELAVDPGSFDVKLSKPEISLDAPNIPDSNVSLKGPEVGIDLPDAELGDLKGKKSKFSMKMPNLNFGKHHADLSLDPGSFDANVSKPDVHVNVLDLPDLDISLKGPEVGVDLPDADLGEMKGKKSKFSMKMPNLSFGKPHGELSLDLGSTEAKIANPEISLNMPDMPEIDVSLKGPKVDLPDTSLVEMKGKKSKFSMKMPEMSANNPNIPELDVSVKGPGVEMDLPEAEIGEMKGKKSKFSMKMPNLNFGKPHVELSGDHGGFDAKLSKPEISLNVPDLPDVDVSLKGPEVDVDLPDVDLGEIKGKKPKFSMKMPNFGKPHAEISLDPGSIDAKLPKPEMSVNVPDLPDVNVSIKGPEVGIDLPEADLGDLKGKKSKFSMKMPNLNFGKPHAELSVDPGNVDFNIPQSEISVNIPDIPDVDVSLKGPQVGIEVPDAELGERKGKKSKFSMKMPHLNLGKPQAELSVDPGSVDMKLSQPEITADFPEIPDVNVTLKKPALDLDLPDVDLGEMKGKKNKFSMKMPNLNFGKAHAELSVDPGNVDVRLPKPAISASIPDIPEVDVTLKGPQVGMDLPEAELGEMKGKKSKFSMKMPNFGKFHGEMVGNVGNVDVKAPKVELSANIPEFDAHSKAGHLEVDLPKVEMGGDLKGKKSKFSMKMPHLSTGKHQADISVNPGSIEGTLPQLDISTTLPDAPGMDVALKAPEVNVDLPNTELADMKGKKSKFSLKMPHLNFGKHQADMSVDTGSLEGLVPGVQLSASMPDVPDVDLNMKGPQVDVNLPDVDLSSDAKEKKSKFSIKMPHINFGKSHAEHSIEGKLPQGDLSVTLPSVPDRDMSVAGPNVNLDLPDVDMKEAKDKKSKFSLKMPHLNMEKTQAELTLGNGNMEGSFSNPELSVNIPNVPDVDVSLKGPNFGVESEHAEMDIRNKSKFSIKMPHLNFGKPHAEISGNVGSIEGNLTQSEVTADMPDIPDINVPEADIDAELKGKKSKFSIKMPHFNLGKHHEEMSVDPASIELGKTNVNISAALPNIPDASVSLNAPTIEVDPIDFDLAEGKGKKAKFSLKMPHLNFGKPHTETSVELGNLEGNLPKMGVSGSVTDVDLSLKAPGVNIDLPEKDIDVNVKGKKSSFSVKLPGLNVEKPQLDVAVHPGTIDMNLQNPEISALLSDISDVNIDGDAELPDLDLGEQKGKKSKFSLKMPHFGRPHVEVSGTTGSIEGKLPEAAIPASLPDVDVDFHDADGSLETKGKKSKFSLKMPHLNLGKHHGDVTLDASGITKPEVSATIPEIPDMNVSVKAPKMGIDADLPQVNLSKEKTSKFSMKIPHMNFGKHSAELQVDPGHVDLVQERGIYATLPDIPDVNVSIKDTHLDVDLPEGALGADLEEHTSKFSLKMPSMKFLKNHADMSVDNGSFEANLPKADISADIPDVGVSLKAPSVDVSLPEVDIGADVKNKKSKFSVKMPEVNFEKPHVHFALNPKTLEGKVTEMSVGSADTADMNVSLKGPKFDVDMRNVDTSGELKSKDSKFSMPQINFGKSHAESHITNSGSIPSIPHGNVTVNVPNLEVDLPEAEMEANLKGKHSKFSMKMPQFNLGKHRADLSVNPGSIEGSLPETELSADSGDVSVSLNAPVLELDLPEVEVGGAKGKNSKFSVKMPHLNLGKSTDDVAVDLSDMTDVNVSFKQPAVDADLSTIELDDIKGKKKSKFSIKMPHLNLRKPHVDVAADSFSFESKLRNSEVPASIPSIPDVSVSVKGPEVEIDHPDMDAISGDVKSKKSKFSLKMPHMNLGKPHADISLDSGSNDCKIPPAEIITDLPDIPDAAISLGTKSVGSSHLEGSDLAVNLSSADVTARVSSPFSGVEIFDTAANSKVHVKLPKLQTHAPGFSGDVAVTPLATGEQESVEDGEKYRLGLKLPKLKSDPLAGALETNFRVANRTGVHLETSAATDQTKPSVGFRAPSFGAKVSAPTTVMQIPTVAIPNAKVSLSTAHVSLEGPHMEYGNNDDIGGVEEVTRKESNKKFSIKFPKLHMGKSHHETVEVESGQVDAKVNVSLPHLENESSQLSAEYGGEVAKSGEAEESKKKKAAKFGVNLHMPTFAFREKDDLDAQTEFKLPRARVSKSTVQLPEEEDDNRARSNEKGSDDEDEEKYKSLRFGIKLKKPKGHTPGKSSSKSKLEDPLEIKIPRVDLSRKGSFEFFGGSESTMEGLSPKDRAEMVKKNSKMSAGVRLPKYHGSIPGGETKEPQLLSITRIGSVVENAEQHGYAEMAVDVPEEYLQRDNASRGISSIVPSSFKTMVPLMNLEVNETTKDGAMEFGSQSMEVKTFRSGITTTAPMQSDQDISTHFVSDNIAVTDSKGRKACSMGDLTRIVAVNDDSSLERTVSLDLRVGSEAVLSLGGTKRSYPDYPVQDLSRVSDEAIVTSTKKRSQGFLNLALDAVEMDDMLLENPQQASGRSVLAIEVNEASWGPTSLYITGKEASDKAFDPNSDMNAGATRSRTDESLSADTTITLESTPTDSSNSSSRTSPLPLTDVQYQYTTVTLSNGNHGREMLEISQSDLENVTFTSLFRKVQEAHDQTDKSLDDDNGDENTSLNPIADSFATVRERFEQLSRHSSPSDVAKVNSSHRLSFETNLRWEEGGSRIESSLQKPVMHIRPVVEQGALSKTVVISGLQLEQHDSSLQDHVNVGSPVPTLEKPL